MGLKETSVGIRVCYVSSRSNQLNYIIFWWYLTLLCNLTFSLIYLIIYLPKHFTVGFSEESTKMG